MTTSYRKGFTLIEMALSMVFIGLLSLSIALIITDTVASYRRGLTLNQINTTGMDIVDDLRTAVQNSSSRAATGYCNKYYGTLNDQTAKNNCEKDNAYNFIYWVKYADVKLNGQSIGNVPIYGAFCTGSYSYIWNSGYYETEAASFSEKTNKKWATLTYKVGDQTTTIGGSTREVDGAEYTKPFRLLKVRDNYRGVCTNVVRHKDSGNSFVSSYKVYDGSINKYNEDHTTEEFTGAFNMSDYGSPGNEDPVDLIMTDKTYDLALYDLFVARPAVSPTQLNTFYSSSFILGTIGGGINILANGKSCSAPNDYDDENFDYCAINKFSFAVQVGGE